MACWQLALVCCCQQRLGGTEVIAMENCVQRLLAGFPQDQQHSGAHQMSDKQILFSGLQGQPMS